MAGPLEGWRVLDLTQGIVGPWVTKLCSDDGVDGIKVDLVDGEVIGATCLESGTA